MNSDSSQPYEQGIKYINLLISEKGIKLFSFKLFSIITIRN